MSRGRASTNQTFFAGEFLTANNILPMRKWHHAFLLFAIAWQVASLPEDIPLNKTRWSNDKTVIVLGYRKISWLVSVSRCFAQPLSNNCKLPITNPSLLILAIIAPVSGYGTDDIEKAKCGYATCLCDMEMIRCFKHYKEDLDLDKHHGWEILQKKSCAFKGNIFFMIKGFLYWFIQNTLPFLFGFKPRDNSSNQVGAIQNCGRREQKGNIQLLRWYIALIYNRVNLFTRQQCGGGLAFLLFR